MHTTRTNLFLALCSAGAIALLSLQGACARKESASVAAGTNQPALSNRELAELKSEWTDSTTGKRIFVGATFEQRLPSFDEKAGYAASGAIPYVITATMTEERIIKGKAIQRSVTGDKASICIYDKDGRIVGGTTIPMAALCHS